METLLPKPPWAYPLRTRQDSVHPQLNIADGGVLKGGGMTGATHRQAKYGEVIGEDLGRQFDIHVGWLSRVTEGPIIDERVGAFEFADVRKEQNSPLKFICPIYEMMLTGTLLSLLWARHMMIATTNNGWMEASRNAHGPWLRMRELLEITPHTWLYWLLSR